ncbi:MAG: 2-oxoglutarate dehydrogenase complex dihydrolipoyllysine-residue succinyltransferase [Flavobacteriales bacterium]|nr:2-oxoglutarate dehydrogenase complex dihydrolipoyllysine-residue succinyltransferase [Flavobacteriales bacterium]HNO49034.1 2-oxoglutarate dehydrogenase complex dihydrolipoyllysine-residue succinyltransferase [Chitinophagales bacterium]
MKQEIKVPSIGESISEVTLASWLVEEGSYVELDQPIAEFESDKATFELPAEFAGVITRAANEGDDIQIGAVVAYIETDAAKPQSTAGNSEKPEVAKTEDIKVSANIQQTTNNTSYASGTPSPAAKKILDEKNIPASDIKGSGVDGRITKEDAQKAEAPKSATNVPASTKPTSPAIVAPTAVGLREERIEKLTRIRKTISRRLVEVKNQTAMLTTFNDVDMSAINEIRAKYKDAFYEQNGVGLGFMSFFTRAVCLALQKFPAVNAYITDENIIYHDYCDVSIAVSTEKGLVVPVIRNAETLSFAGIEKEIKRLAVLARNNELSMQDMEGGTFTITNGGVFGSLMSTPIINQPQSAILGMHRVDERPVVINGNIEIRPMMYLALSYDHRIIDGKDSVSFLATVKSYLENPEKMLIAL